jgi:hypothetical protein
VRDRGENKEGDTNLGRDRLMERQERERETEVEKKGDKWETEGKKHIERDRRGDTGEDQRGKNKVGKPRQERR